MKCATFYDFQENLMSWLRFFSRPLLTAAFIGFATGMIAVLSLEKIDQLTSTDSFCSDSCHTMKAYVAYEPDYVNSSHRMTYTGIQAGCADCHIPKGLIAATWTHAVSGLRDTWSLLVNDFSTRNAWNNQRKAMVYRVREHMLANDSETCRSCHTNESLKPRRARGQRRHELAQRKKMTCIACHYNLIHEPVKPRPDFLRKAGFWLEPTE